MTTDQLTVEPTANPNKALWEQGDFTQIAKSMRSSGEELIASLDVTSDMQVLDLGCGDGTTAVPAAQRGARVLGVDIASNLVAAGNARAKEAGLMNLFFQEGDASNLSGLANNRFDLVVSIFGAMFAPRPLDVAREMVRVTRPGGRIVMGNWIPGDETLVAQILKISAAYMPTPPAGFISPMSWGVVSEIHDRFSAAGIPIDHISCEPTPFIFRVPGPPVGLLDTFKAYYGPTMNSFKEAAKTGREGELYAELSALFERLNRGGEDETVMTATFMKVTVRKPS